MDFKEVMDTSNTFTVGMKGQYHWNLLVNAHNTEGGKLKYSKTTEISTSISRRGIVERVKEQKRVFDLGMKMERTVGAKVKMIDIQASNSITMGFHTMAYNMLKENTEESFSKTEKKTISVDYEVGPGEKFRLYQLSFNGPGVNLLLDTFVSDPVPFQEVKVNCTFANPTYDAREILKVLGDTEPGRDNRLEWKKIREVIAFNLTKPMETRIDTLIEVLRNTYPGRDNKLEWEMIRKHCNDIRTEPVLNDRIERLADVLSKIRPGRDNKLEWERIRNVCNKFLSQL